MWRDSETETDYLDFSYIVEIMKDTINDEKLLPSCIGLYGDWGSGKSSLMHMCKKKLEEQKDGTVCLLFNGWLYESYDDAKTAILASILDGIKEGRDLSRTANITLKALYDSIDKFKVIKGGIKFGIDMAVTGGLGAITNLTIKEIMKKTKKVAEDIDEETMFQVIKDKLDYKEVREDIREFRKKFAELINDAGIKKLVIFVDELDRCSPVTILDTLEAMRLFLFNGNVSFVIGADERHVTYAIRSKFNDIEGINMDIGKEYQEKLIQYPIRIPCMNKDETEFYIMCLLSQNELSATDFEGLLEFLQEKRKQNPLEFSITMEILKEYNEPIATRLNESLVLSKQLSGILTQGLNGNPRQCKRFLNTLDMRQKMAKYKNVTLKSSVLAKIMEVEYFQTTLFRKMITLLGDNMLKTELEGFETDQEEKIVALDPWKNELWVKKWMNAKPMLSEEKLENYFYFMRVSAKETIFTSVEKMSEEAKKIFEGLSKHSDLVFNQAKMVVDKMSAFDQNQILDGLYQDMVSDDRYVKEKVSFFLQWGALNEQLQENTIKYCTDLLAQKIQISQIPYFEGFYTQCKNKAAMKTILERWKDENTTLKTVIEGIL